MAFTSAVAPFTNNLSMWSPDLSLGSQGQWPIYSSGPYPSTKATAVKFHHSPIYYPSQTCILCGLPHHHGALTTDHHSAPFNQETYLATASLEAWGTLKCVGCAGSESQAPQWTPRRCLDEYALPNRSSPLRSLRNQLAEMWSRGRKRNSACR